MCGIMGYVGSRSAPKVLLEGLKRLEYRGYDSAGIALELGSKIEIQKSEGRLENVEKLVQQDPRPLQKSQCGIGHTRWATHGKPTTQNAHPHQIEDVVLVHNGIIENYIEIRNDLIARGHRPQSETDSELFGFLVLESMEKGQNLVGAVRESFGKIRGQCSIVVMSEKEPGLVVGVRNGSPLVVAIDPEGGAIFASDSQPLLPFTREVIFLEHGDVAVATAKSLKILDLETGQPRKRETSRLEWSPEQIDKSGFPHYMLKEIHEQPGALIDTLNGLLDRNGSEPFTLAAQPGVEILRKAQEIVLLACGTSWHAAMVGKYWLESWARIPVSVDLASEFRYRNPVIRPGTVVIGISQSGETADTLAVLRDLRNQGIPCLGISNVRRSSISRDADDVFYTSAGPEIGVAATKTFLAQMVTLLIFAGFLARERKTRKIEELSKLFEDLVKLPHVISEGLEADSPMMKKVESMVNRLTPKGAPTAGSKGFFFMGRGHSFPIALEGALKLKEIAYDHAEGYAAGELKHGPIAMLDSEMVVVVLAPQDQWHEKTGSNLQEVKARGAKVVGVGSANDHQLSGLCDFWIPLPQSSASIHSDFLPFVLSPVIQLLSYHRAVLKGTDVDKPRNLAKSVTVE